MRELEWKTETHGGTAEGVEPNSLPYCTATPKVAPTSRGA